MVCVRCFVSGQVQGVFYRASTQTVARQLGLTGYARNLMDGRVEVLACGDQDNVDQLKDWLWQGSTHAKVSEVVCVFADEEPPVCFMTE